MSLTSYKDLIVWQKSFALVLEIYKITGKFPPHELFGLVSQMRRASISVPSNIAEGYSRNNRGEYVHFVAIAYASGAELETQLLLAKELNYLTAQDFIKINSLLVEVLKMLNKLLSTLKH